MSIELEKDSQVIVPEVKYARTRIERTKRTEIYTNDGPMENWYSMVYREIIEYRDGVVHHVENLEPLRVPVDMTDMEMLGILQSIAAKIDKLAVAKRADGTWGKVL